MVPKQKIVIFDLDGTLLDVSKRWYLLHSDLAKKFHANRLNQKTYINLKRQHIPEEQILKGKLPNTIIKKYLKKRKDLLESEHYLSFDHLKPKATKLLESLSASHRLYLTTSRAKPRILKDQLRQMGISGYFVKVVCGKSLKSREKKLKKIIAGNPAKYFLVGDSERDHKLARNLKIKSILVCDGSRTRKFLLKLKPDAIFGKISSLNEKAFS